jgi:hypothetical protein
MTFVFNPSVSVLLKSTWVCSGVSKLNNGLTTGAGGASSSLGGEFRQFVNPTITANCKR